jgi:hypothetical protein
MKRSRARTLVGTIGSLAALRAIAVLALAVASALTLGACKRPGGKAQGSAPPRGPSASVFHADDGHCELIEPVQCPKGAPCDLPTPLIIDCPAHPGDAGAGANAGANAGGAGADAGAAGAHAGAPAAPSRRPPGKEDWLRVRPHLWIGPRECAYEAERFCAPPGKPFECTPEAVRQSLSCSSVIADAGAGGEPEAAGDANGEPSGPAVTSAPAPAKPPPTPRYEVDSFVYRDGVGACHRVPKIICEVGDCPLPEGDPAPCP